MHVELDKAIDLDHNTECAAIVVCKRIAHVSSFQSRLRSLYYLCLNQGNWWACSGTSILMNKIYNGRSSEMITITKYFIGNTCVPPLKLHGQRQVQISILQ